MTKRRHPQPDFPSDVLLLSRESGPACFGGAAPHGNDCVLLPTYVVYFRRHVVINHLNYILDIFTRERATTSQTTPDRCMAWAFQRVFPTSLVSGVTSITSVAWDHGSPQPRFATGSRDGTIFVWTPSFQPGGTTPARKAPRIKWQSLQPVSAPPTREILSSPTEGESAVVNPDIEFGAL